MLTRFPYFNLSFVLPVLNWLPCMGCVLQVVVSIPQSADYLNIVVDASGRESTESKDQMETVHVRYDFTYVNM